MENKKRLEYIDAMRGLAIILVLQSHVSGLCLNIDDYTPNLHFVSGVPLFFFISGFLTKQITGTSLKYISSLLFEKLVILVLAATIFILFRAHITGVCFVDAFLDGKYGYWFTFSLFQFIFLHICYQLIFAHLVPSRKDWPYDVVLLAIALLMYSLSIPVIKSKIAINEEIYTIIDIGHWKHFLYFSMGVIFKRHFHIIAKTIESSFSTIILMTVFVLSTVYSDNLIENVNTLFRFFFPILWVIICLAFFLRYQEFFSNKTIIGKCFQFVGQKTLDIYYLHIFFLPRSLSETLSVFHDNPIPIIEYAVTTIIVALIILVCIAISSFIRLSPPLAHYLLGTKKQK